MLDYMEMEDHEYGEKEFDIAEIITPEDLIEGMKDKTKDLFFHYP